MQTCMYCCAHATGERDTTGLGLGLSLLRQVAKCLMAHTPQAKQHVVECACAVSCSSICVHPPSPKHTNTHVCTSRFYQTHGRYPGSYDDTVEDDMPLLKSVAGQVLAELGVSGGVAVQDDIVGEMCRCACGCVAGGVVTCLAGDNMSQLLPGRVRVAFVCN